MFVPLDRGHLPGERSMKYYVTKKEKIMKKTIKIKRSSPERKIVGYVGSSENLVIAFSSPLHHPQVKTCVLNPSDGSVRLNGTGSIEYISDHYKEEETIYEGDSITIQF
jgi:hypothetical protein